MERMQSAAQWSEKTPEEQGVNGVKKDIDSMHGMVDHSHEME